MPFENLSIHLGEPVDFTEAALVDKIVRRHRGGFCYELNGAFALLLRELGFEVSLLSARMYDNEGVVGAPFDHLALRVDVDQPWLADVGAGRHARYPLRMHATEPQADLTCSLATPRGRSTHSGDTLIETVDGERIERTLANDSEILATYKDRFGIVLDQAPRLSARNSTASSPGIR